MSNEGQFAASGRYKPRQYVNRISEALREYQRDHNLTQAELAARVGLKRLGVRGLELGYHVPSTATIRRIALVMEWTLEELGAVVMSLPIEPTRYEEAA